MTKRLGRALLTVVLALAAGNELHAQEGGALFSNCVPPATMAAT